MSADGTQYKGKWEHGRKHGKGKWEDKKGNSYEGDWQDDKVRYHTHPPCVNRMYLSYLSSTFLPYRDMEQEPSRMPQEMYIKANGYEIVWKAKAFIPLYTEIPMKAHGKTIR